MMSMRIVMRYSELNCKMIMRPHARAMSVHWTQLALVATPRTSAPIMSRAARRARVMRRAE